MNDEAEPARIVKLGTTRLVIDPDQAGGYVLRSSDGTWISAPFTRDEAQQFARELLDWAREEGQD